MRSSDSGVSLGVRGEGKGRVGKGGEGGRTEEDRDDVRMEME